MRNGYPGIIYIARKAHHVPFHVEKTITQRSSNVTYEHVEKSLIILYISCSADYYTVDLGERWNRSGEDGTVIIDRRFGVLPFASLI